MNIYRTKLSEIVSYLLFSRGISPTELSQLTGVPQPTIHRIVRGICPRPHLSTLAPIAEYFKLSVKQLMGQEYIHGLNIYALNQEKSWAKIPVLDRYRLQIPEDSEEVMEIPPMTFTSANVSPGAFALYLVDTRGMTEEFSEGMRLVFQPRTRAELKHNDYVLLRLVNTRILFRQIVSLKQGYSYKTLDTAKEPPTMLHRDDYLLGVLVEAIKTY